MSRVTNTVIIIYYPKEIPDVLIPAEIGNLLKLKYYKSTTYYNTIPNKLLTYNRKSKDFNQKVLFNITHHENIFYITLQEQIYLVYHFNIII